MACGSVERRELALTRVDQVSFNIGTGYIKFYVSMEQSSFAKLVEEMISSGLLGRR